MSPVTTRKRKAEMESESQSSAQTSPAKDKKKQKDLPVRAKDDAPTKTSPAKGTLITFGDDDDDAGHLGSTAGPSDPISSSRSGIAEIVIDDGEGGGDSDSDDAPEAVPTHKAADDAKQQASAAKKAAQEQAADQKKKRQQRDALFKQQAEERKKADPVTADVTAAPEKNGKSLLEQHVKQTGGRNRPSIPKVLPAEFLTDSSDEEDEEDEEDAAVDMRRPKKRKISAIEKKLSRQSKAPVDERIGATVYRVTKKTDERLAPKAKKYSQSSKDVLLRRNRTAVQPRGGFFTKS